MEDKGVFRRKHKALEEERFREENCYTNSGLEQRNTEESCLRLFEKAERACNELGDTLPVLNRVKTVGFVRRGLCELSQGYECLDASRPWLVYWLLHSLQLLGEELTEEEKRQIVGFLQRCQDPSGGFAGHKDKDEGRNKDKNGRRQGKMTRTKTDREQNGDEDKDKEAADYLNRIWALSTQSHARLRMRTMRKWSTRTWMRRGGGGQEHGGGEGRGCG